MESRRAWAKDALGAVALAEAAVAGRILVGLEDAVQFDETNAFGKEVIVERGSDPISLVRRLAERAADAERVTLLATARSLVLAREGLVSLAAQRIGVVVHAFVDDGCGEALPLADMGWGVLLSSGVVDSLDLALIARRAAEDCGTPFFVVHVRSQVRHTEPLLAPSKTLCEAYIGAAQSRIRRRSDPSHPIHADVSERAFAERVPFALASAMRELEGFTNRRHDVLERHPANDAAIVLVGLGPLGDSLHAEVDRLRASGHDVGAIKLTAFRPFPGPKLVKALTRTLAVSVIEDSDAPLAQSNPLARELKASFADALTWAPDYPGVGRIPRIVSGVVRIFEREFESADVDAMVHNMLADERGKRLFVLGSDDALGLSHAPVARAHSVPLSMRGYVRDAKLAPLCADLCATVIASALGLRVRASVRALSAQEGDGYAFDLLATPDRTRGGHVPHALRLIVVEDASSLLRGHPLHRLADGGTLAVRCEQEGPDGVWGELPPYVKALVCDRHARLLGFRMALSSEDEDARWSAAAAFAGVFLAGASLQSDIALEPKRVVSEVFSVVKDVANEGMAHRIAEIARMAFEGGIEVPRTIVERDLDTIRLGRRDTRAGGPAR